MPFSSTPHPGSSPAQQAEQIDVRAYWRTIVRRRWVVLPFFLATLLVTVVFSLRSTKIFDSACTLIIDLAAPKVLDNQQVQDVVESGTGGYWYTKEYYETQYKVITSRAVAQRVLDKLLLAQNLRFLGVSKIADPVEREKKRQQIDPVEILQRNLKVEPVKDSRVVRVRYEDPDPDLAALIANTFAEAYIAENLAVKVSTTRSASDWLEQQLADLESKLEKTGQALFEFKKLNDILSTSWEDRQSMVSQRLTAINDALTKARIQKAQLSARNEAIQALGDKLDTGGEVAESLQPVAESQTIQQLKLRYLEASADCAEVRERYLEHHPKAEGCLGKVAAARDVLRHEIRTVLSAAQKEYQEVTQTERKLLALYNDTKSEAFNFNQHEREYTELKRAYDNNQRLYDLVLKRLKDTGMTGLLQTSNVRILDRARPNIKPLRPKVQQNIILAVLLGLLGGIGLAFAAEYLDATITSQDQIEEKLGLTFLGIVPRIEKGKEGTAHQDLVVYAQPKSAVAECLRSVRTNLQFMSPEKPLRTILVTSSGPQEGKTTTAAALAETMAGSGNRVLLVDADMRRPRIHRIFGLPNTTGLSALIVGEEKLENAVQPTVVPNLFILPCGPIPPNPAELLQTEGFKSVLAEMCRSFDRVILDSPPIGVVADAAVLSTGVDGTLLVLKAGRTSRDAAKQGIKQLRDVNARLFGAVLNDLDLQDQKYGQYYHYYRYGYYYGDKKESSAA
jgi:capsular exopolysaccharide synthesis family protein